MDTPKSPSPTTSIPLTVPAPNDVLRAGARPLIALLAVRTFARTAIHIPKYPIIAENIAPIKNVAAIPLPNVNAMIIARTAIMGKTTLNCFLR